MRKLRDLGDRPDDKISDRPDQRSEIGGSASWICGAPVVYCPSYASFDWTVLLTIPCAWMTDVLYVLHSCYPLATYIVVLGKFGFKPIQTRFEPKPNQWFWFWFGDSCHETKLFGFGLGNQ